MGVSLVPRFSHSLSLELRREGREEREPAWYTLFAHVLIISVITRVCIILEIYGGIHHGCVQKINIEIMYWRTCRYAAHTTASDGLLDQSLVKLLTIIIIKTMLQSVLSLWSMT